MKLVISLILLATLSIGGYFGYQKYEDDKKRESALSTLKQASIRLKYAIQLSTDGQSGTTYMEVFKFIDDETYRLNESILTLRSDEKAGEMLDIKSIEDYLKTSQITLRALQNIMRAQMSFSTAKALYGKSDEEAMSLFLQANQTQQPYSEQLEKAVGTMKQQILAMPPELSSYLLETAALDPLLELKRPPL